MPDPLPLATFSAADRMPMQTVLCVHVVVSISYLCNIFSNLSIILLTGSSYSISSKLSERKIEKSYVKNKVYSFQFDYILILKFLVLKVTSTMSNEKQKFCLCTKRPYPSCKQLFCGETQNLPVIRGKYRLIIISTNYNSKSNLFVDRCMKKYIVKVSHCPKVDIESQPAKICAFIENPLIKNSE